MIERGAIVVTGIIIETERINLDLVLLNKNIKEEEVIIEAHHINPGRDMIRTVVEIVVVIRVEIGILGILEKEVETEREIGTKIVIEIEKEKIVLLTINSIDWNWHIIN